jgi:hypothetical protein
MYPLPFNTIEYFGARTGYHFECTSTPVVEGEII